MKKLSIALCMLCALSLFTNTSRAQNLKWNPTEKVSGNKHQYYIGANNGSHYLLICNEGLRNESPHDRLFSNEIGFTIGNKSISLIKYDTGFHIVANKELKFGKKMDAFINGAVSDKNIYLFYRGKGKITPILADVLTMDGDYVETRTLQEDGTAYDIAITPDRKKIYMAGNGELVILDNNLKAAAKKVLPSKTGYSISVENSGEVYGYGRTNSKMQAIFYYDPQAGNLLSANLSFTKGRLDDFIVKRNKNTLYAIGLYGESYSKKEASIISGSSTINVPSSITAYEVHTLDFKTMKEQSVTTHKFPEETVKKFMRNPDKDKMVGIDYLQFENIYFTSKDEMIIVSQCETMIAVEETSHSGSGAGYSSNTSTSYRYIDGNIYLFKLDAKGELMKDKVIERKVSVPAYLEQMAGMSSFFANNKVYIIRGNLAYDQLSSDLETESSNTIHPYKVADIELTVGQKYWLSENQYLMTGAYGKHLGSVIISF